jgi:hypothetical protein
MESINDSYKEELKIELGNAIAAYGQVLRKASLGISSPGFEHLIKCSDLELTYKMEMLKDFYNNF